MKIFHSTPWAKVRKRLVDDANDVFKWWSTWLFLAIAIVCAVAAGIEAMPQEVKECLSISYPRWVLIAVSVLAMFGPFLRVVRQDVKSNG